MSCNASADLASWPFCRGAGVWSVAEIYVSIICACLPAAKLVLQRAWQKLSRQLPRTSSDGSGNVQLVAQTSPALTAGSNRISLRTSITVSSPQELPKEEPSCALGFTDSCNGFNGGVKGYNCRTKTTITAGALPKSPW